MSKFFRKFAPNLKRLSQMDEHVINSTIKFDQLYKLASAIIENARITAYRHINEALVRRNWLIGKLIVEEELNLYFKKGGKARA